MSTAQRNDACLISIGPEQADVLRHQTLVVLEANHYYFEDLLDFSPEAQHALSVIYRDAFAVLDAIGWAPELEPRTVEVPLTAGHVEQLRHRRHELAHANLDPCPHLTSPSRHGRVETSTSTAPPSPTSTRSSPPQNSTSHERGWACSQTSLVLIQAHPGDARRPGQG